MYEEIKAIISDVAGIDASEITHDAQLKKLMDSLTVLEVMLAIESRYDIRFDQCEVERETTVNDVVRAVKIKVAHNV